MIDRTFIYCVMSSCPNKIPEENRIKNVRDPTGMGGSEYCPDCEAGIFDRIDNMRERVKSNRLNRATRKPRDPDEEAALKPIHRVLVSA